MRPTRVAAILAALVLSGCQSTGGGGNARILDSYDERLRLPVVDERVTTTTEADPGRTYAALLQAWRDLGLEPTAINTNARTVATQNVKVRGRLAGQKISRYLECGYGPSGSHADNYMVFLDLRAEVLPQEAGSALRIYFSGWAESPEGARGDRIRCGSSGALESRIAQIVSEAVKPAD